MLLSEDQLTSTQPLLGRPWLGRPWLGRPWEDYSCMLLPTADRRYTLI